MAIGNTQAVSVQFSQVAALLRPHQWLKNGFVCLGLVFSHRWMEVPLVQAVAMATAAFCAISSAVYVFNDLIDVESDRLHPKKCSRPIASRAVPEPLAWVLCLLLLLTALVLASLVSTTAVEMLLCYAALNVAYSYQLKHVVVIDVFVISAGFMLRILVGTLGVGIAPSSWLLLCSMMLTLLMGFCKRRAELMVANASGVPARKVLAQYDISLLDRFLAITAACAVLAYSVYTVSPDTVRLHGTDKLVYTVPFVVYGIFRYLFLVGRSGMGQDTARDLLTDPHLLMTVGAWVFTVVLILS